VSSSDFVQGSAAALGLSALIVKVQPQRGRLAAGIHQPQGAGLLPGRAAAVPRPRAGLGWLLALAWSHAVLSLTYLLVLVTGLHSARRVLMRRTVRRTLDTTTGAVLLGFGAKLATEHV
jgi:hypothetical protein